MYKKLNDFHNKFTRFKTVAPRRKDKRIIKNKVLSNARNLYSHLYYIYKNKYNKEINRLNTKNTIKLDYNKLRLAGDYEYLSEEEQEEQQKEEQEEEQEEKQKEEQEEKQKEEQEEQEENQKEEEEEQKETFPIKSDDKTEQQTSKKLKDDAIALNKWILDEEENINTELFKKYFKFQRPSDILNYLNKINDKEKNSNLMNMINTGLKNLKKRN